MHTLKVVSSLLRSSSSRYVQVSAEMPTARHSGMDAGIQAQGCESSQILSASNQRIRMRKITVHGTGYRHPCRYDGSAITVSRVRMNMQQKELK